MKFRVMTFSHIDEWDPDFGKGGRWGLRRILGFYLRSSRNIIAIMRCHCRIEDSFLLFNSARMLQPLSNQRRVAVEF